MVTLFPQGDILVSPCALGSGYNAGKHSQNDVAPTDSTPENVTLHRGRKRNPILVLSKIPRQS